MKLNIKSLLTGTTLFAASASNINAVPPKGMELIPNETIPHPIFGEMKVISHKEDLDFYHQKVKEEEGDHRDPWRILMEKFIQYVLSDDAFKQCEGFSQEDIEWFVRKVISKSVTGMAMLEVITANYMREYDRIKQFCEKHQAELKACYDFSQTENGKALYEKERQIFELEEKLKDLLWEIQSEQLESQFSKSGISSKDLKNLYEYFRKEEEVFNNELKESWTQLRKEDSEGFFIGEKDYEPFCKLYEHFLKKNDDDSDDDSDNNLAIHYQSIGQDSERYKKLQKFVVDHQTGFENFFNIGDLCFAGKTLLRDSFDERCCRNYYSEHTEDLEQLSLFRQEEAKLLETAKLNTKTESFFASMDKLEKLYKEETKKVNEEKFSCIRRSVIPACCFPILYQHFFVKDDQKYSDIENVNKFLYRTLKFKDAGKSCSFDWRTLSVMGNWDEAEEIQNYHVNDRNEFSDYNDENQTTGLQHELMHFMNAIDDLNRLKACEKISEQITDIIKDTKRFEKDFEQPETAQKIIQKLYDNGAEMWAMYGVCICEDKQNPGKYTLYYDPINEAVANAEALQVVRTGHARFKNENHIDPDDKKSPSEIEVLEALNEKIGVYNFYFSEGETLRKLIRM